MRRLIFLALLLSACGGSPSSPSTVVPTTTPQTSVARDGITGADLGPVPISGGMASVNLPGYIPRSQPSSPVVWLWPQDQEYVRQLVYVSAGNGAAIGLQRWASSSVLRVAFVAGLTRWQGLLNETAAELARVSRVGVVVLEPGDQSANIVLAVDETVPANFSAVTRKSLSGSQIVSARISFYSERAIANDPWSNLLLHELGHVLGLGHSSSRWDVMSNATGRNNARAFSDAESRALTMMYAWRRAGNTFPDNEPQGLPASRREVETIACR